MKKNFEIIIAVSLIIWLWIAIFRTAYGVYDRHQTTELLKYQAKNCEPMG